MFLVSQLGINVKILLVIKEGRWINLTSSEGRTSLGECSSIIILGKSTLLWLNYSELLLSDSPQCSLEAFLPGIALGVKNATGCFSLSTPSLSKHCSSSAEHIQFTFGVIYKLIQFQNREMTV